MRRKMLCTLLTFFVTSSLLYAAEPGVRPLRNDVSQTWDDAGREMRAWLNRWWGRLAGAPSHEERPLISLMLTHREKLGLSADQVRHLERLRSDFEKESIRNDADLRIAELDLESLLEGPNVDMAKAEAKVREIEKLRADLRIARIRAVEKGKEQLTGEQRQKLQDLLNETGVARRRAGPER